MTAALDVIVERTVTVRGELPHVAPPVLWVWADDPLRIVLGHPTGSWPHAVRILVGTLTARPAGVAVSQEGFALLDVDEATAHAQGWRAGDVARLSIYDERVRSVLEVKAWTPADGHRTVLVPITIDDDGLGRPDPVDGWRQTYALPLSARTPGDEWHDAIATLAGLTVPGTLP